jgi:hypothetical protein
MVLLVLVGLIGVRRVVEQLAEISTITSTTTRPLVNLDTAGIAHLDGYSTFCSAASPVAPMPDIILSLVFIFFFFLPRATDH